VAAIKKRGGGWIEAVPMAFPHDDPTVRKLRRTFGWRSTKSPNTYETPGPARKSQESANSAPA